MRLRGPIDGADTPHQTGRELNRFRLFFTESETMNDQTDDVRGENFDWAGIKPFLADHMAEQQKIDDIMQAAKDKCSPLRDKQKAIKDKAEDAGFKKRVFNSAVAMNKALNKYNVIPTKLDDDQQEDVAKIKKALGMPEFLPLFGESQPEPAKKG